MMIKKLNKTKNKLLGILFFCSIITSTSFGQYWTNLGGGTYEFYSEQPSANLSFFLFGDGYHSFDHQVTHVYSQDVISPTHYTAGPYDPEDVEESVLPATGLGSTLPVIEPIALENKVQLMRSWNLVPGKENYFILAFENKESNEPINGCIEFHFNDFNSNINSSEILDYPTNIWVSNKQLESSDYIEYTHKFKWEFNNLTFGEQRFIYIPAECLADVFDKVDTRAVMKVDDPENDVIECDEIIEEDRGEETNNGYTLSSLYTLSSIVSSNPHDPNSLEVKPNAIYLCDSDQMLRYKVTFQNEGETPAQNVFVNLNIDVDYQNVQLVTATDMCHLVWDPHGIRVVFPDIFLPGMAQVPSPKNYWETVGSFEIDVCVNLYDYPNPTLQAKGDIVFDSEEPIPISNEIVRIVDCFAPINFLQIDELYKPNFVPDCPLLAHNQYFIPPFTNNPYQQGGRKINEYKDQDAPSIKLYPNPVTNHLYFNELTSLNVEKIEIFNLQGQLVLSQDQLDQSGVDVSSLINGMYLISVRLNGKLKVVKFVKE